MPGTVRLALGLSGGLAAIACTGGGPGPAADTMVRVQSAPQAAPSPDSAAVVTQPQATGWPTDAAVAEVGGVQIPSRDFFAIFAQKTAKYTERGREMPAPAAKRYRQTILDRLTHQELLRQEAQRVGFVYDQGKLAERIAAHKLGIRDWDKHLQRRGETEESLRATILAEQLEEGILAAQGELTVTRAEIEADYAVVKGNWDSDQERVRAQHIVLLVGGQGMPPQDAVKRKADAVYAEATAAGADFAALVRKYSTGPSVGKGGDLGILTRDRMVDGVGDVAFKLAVGQVSKPILTKFGYHIIKVTGRWPKGPLPLSALEDQLSERIAKRKLHLARRALKERMLGAAKVVWWMDLETGAKLETGGPPQPVEPAATGHVADKHPGQD